MSRRDELEARAGQDGSLAPLAFLIDPLPAPLRQALTQGMGACQLAGEGLDWRVDLGRK